jgi:hypothetical protein
MAATQTTLTFSNDPLKGKLRFKMRTLNNFLLVIGVFTIFALYALVLLPEHVWIADILAIGVLVYLHYAFLNKRAIWIRCPHCDKKIATNTPWVCGVCQAKNEHVDNFPFVNRCESCGVEPKAYQCHHEACRELIFITEDEQTRNFAYCINTPAEIPPPDARTVKRQGHEESKEEKMSSIELAELDLKLKEIKAKHDGPKIKSPFEQKKEQWESEYVGIMGLQEYVHRKTIEVKELYKDDPVSLKDALDAIEEVKKRHI